MDQDDELVTRCQGRVGATLKGKWRLDELIGVGGMAAVYAASHRNGNRAAIKILHPEIAAQPEARDRFAREAYIANTVGHEGAVAVQDDDVDEEGSPFLVMELLIGESVAGRADRNGARLPLGEALWIVSHALAVLELAHAKGVVHRDIKPENLFLTEDGRLKVLDFGVARLNETTPGGPKRTRTGFLLGTPGYMAPEQALGRWNEVDARTNLWAVGATLFNLLSGQDVHEGSTTNEQIVAAATRPPRSLARAVPGAPLEVVKLVDKSLAFDQQRRFPDARTMRVEVDRLAAENGADASLPFPSASIVTRASRAPGAEAKAAMSAPTEAEEPPAEEEPPPPISSSFGSVTAGPEEIAALRELFTLLERAILAKLQYGPTHKEVARRFEGVFKQAAAAIERGTGRAAWNISPYAFVVGRDVLWEPRTPLDALPYRLFADGVRMMAITRGLEPRELLDLVDILMRDPARDIAPEDDLVTMLWDGRFTHIKHESYDSFAEGDQDERARFENERQKVIALANFDTSFQLEDCWQARPKDGGGQGVGDKQRSLMRALEGEAAARAAALEVKEGGSMRPRTMGATVDEATRTALAARLELDAGEVGERFVVAAAGAFVQASHDGAAAQIAVPLRAAIDGLAGTAPADAVAFVCALSEAVHRCEQAAVAERDALSAALAGALVSVETLKVILAGATASSADQLTAILRLLDATHVPAVVEAVRTTHDPGILAVLLAYLERVGDAHVAEIGPLLPVVDVEAALALLRMLMNIGTPEARNAATHAAQSPHPIVRIEALGHLEGATSDRLRLELKRLLEDREPGVRLATLRAIAKHAVKAAGPSLVLRIRSGEFDGLPVEERRQALDTLSALAPSRAEAVSIELLADHRIVSTDAHEQTRALAAELLAREGSTPEAVDVLNDASRGRWRNSERVRSAATRALPSVAARASRPPPARAASMPAPAISPPGARKSS